MEYIGRKVSVSETNTLLCNASELSNGIITGHDKECELFHVEFTFKGRRQDFAMLLVELVFEDE
jgi:hypothetical protein